MAPPIPGLSRPPAMPRRPAGDVLAGILAVLALLALTAGVPLGLITVFGLPIPQSMPTMSVLTHQLDIHAVLQVLMVVVWLAWLQLLCCVFAEVRAAVRNAGMPARVPLAGGTQAVAHRLVTAALVLFTATVALSPAISHHAPPRPPAVAAAVLPGPAAAVLQAPAAAEFAIQRDYAGPSAEKIYVVKPPVGRYHESLWEIAENHLGNGRRYPEIYELNKDHVQPDGSRLTIASLIRPGWVLHMPRDAHGPGIEVVRRGEGPDARAVAGHAGQVVQAAGHRDQRGSQKQWQPDGVAPADGRAPGQHGGGAGTAAVGHGDRPAAPHSAPSPGIPWLPAELAAASLLAAGVLSALGRRRREQLWQRAFGRRVAAPAGDAALAEAALRLGANQPSARLLDAGLRSLSAALAELGKVPPNVFAAHLSEDYLDLWIAPADTSPPRPWLAMSDGQVWRLPLAAAARLDPDEAGGAMAPYPGLVSIGTDDSGRVLVDLEAAHGLIAVSGPDHQVRAALAAMAVELATNRWSDRMQITLVGFGAELAMLAPERVAVAPALADVLPGLERRAAEAEAALAAAGADSVLTGRSRGVHPDACAPHYLIMADPPAPAERERLVALARTRDRMAAGYVVAGDVPGATWTWEVTGEGRLRAPLLGFDVQAQLLPARQYAAVAELFRAASESVGVGLSRPDAGAAPAAQLIPGAMMPVEICMLGPVSVRAPGTIEPDRVALATEIVVFLAAHPGGVHPNVLTGAIWPRGVTPEVRDAALARAAAWLGGTAGQGHLVIDSTGRLLLGPQVRVDWQVLRALVARAEPGLADGGQGEAGYLERALAEVRGQLLDGRDPGRYLWLATDDLEYEVTALVADTAHRLSVLRLAAGDFPGAMDAARCGLRLAFNDELLWRDLLIAAHATGEDTVLRAVVGEVSARAALDEVLPRLAPETESLIDEILPSWRSSVA
jgi:hypothetical protein